MPVSPMDPPLAAALAGDDATIRTVARLALGSPDAAIGPWRLGRTGAPNGPATAGVYRLSGQGRGPAGRARPWRMILKVLHPITPEFDAEFPPAVLGAGSARLRVGPARRAARGRARAALLCRDAPRARHNPALAGGGARRQARLGAGAVCPRRPRPRALQRRVCGRAPGSGRALAGTGRLAARPAGLAAAVARPRGRPRSVGRAAAARRLPDAQRRPPAAPLGRARAAAARPRRRAPHFLPPGRLAAQHVLAIRRAHGEQPHADRLGLPRPGRARHGSRGPVRRQLQPGRDRRHAARRLRRDRLRRHTWRACAPRAGAAPSGPCAPPTPPSPR